MAETRPVPQASLDPDVIRVASFVVCGFLISVKADGRFPLPDSLSEVAFQLLLLPYTLALVVAVTAFLCAGRAARLIERAVPRGLLQVSPVSWALGSLVVFELVSLVVLQREASKYAQFGYALKTSVLLALAAFSGMAFIFASWRGRLNGTRIFVAAGVTYLASQFVSLVSFPLHSGRSDMLPLIEASARRLLGGVNPYGLYEIPHTVPLTYLPGTWLPFVPAVVFGLDPRVAHFLATLLAATFLVFAAPKARRDIAGCLGALFLLTPYLQYRHEIYLGTLWLALGLVAFLHSRGASRWLGLALGWAVATSQFVWVMVPVYVVQLFRRRDLGSATRVMATTLVTSAALTTPLLILGPHEFVRGIFGHWQGTFDVTTANLGYFIARFASLEGLRVVQIGAWIASLITLLRRLRPTDSPWGAMAAVLGVFVLFNSVVWVYFYLTIFFVMMASVSLEERAK